MRQRLRVPPRPGRVRTGPDHDRFREFLSMTEKPVERLNYYNGQRLEASDLKLEQEYHIRVRRWLNKSLYSAGIARGLEVRDQKKVDPNDPSAPVVVVGPG